MAPLSGSDWHRS